MRWMLGVLLVLSSGLCFGEEPAGQKAIVDLVRSGRKIPYESSLYIGNGYVGRSADGIRITQIIDDETALASWGRRDFVIRGMKTKGLADDRSYSFSGLIAIVDTHSYTTVTGAMRTLPVIDVVPMQRLQELIKDLQNKARVRTWSNGDEGAFVEFKNDKLEIAVNGENKIIPSKDVSKDDRDWIRKILAAEATDKKAIESLTRHFK